jgi:hypothetical protein
VTSSTDPLAGLSADLRAQRDFVADRAPVYARVLEQLEARVDRLAPALARAWADRSFGGFYERPLLILAALRDDALAEGEGHPLWPAIGAREADPDAVTTPAVEAALAADRDRLWRSLRERHVQTNETSRAVAWLWPAHLCAGADPDRPLALFDIGASAGLNLIADALPAMWSTTGGAALPLSPRPEVIARTGFDLRPIDAGDDRDARWLRACVWPGQTARLDRLEAAIAELRAARSRPGAPVMVEAGAAEVPDRVAATDLSGARALCYQTVVRDYLPADERERYDRGMRALIADREPGAILWIELEVTGAARTGGPPAAITAHVRDRDGGVLSRVLAHCDPHPAIIDVDAAAVAALVECLR